MPCGTPLPAGFFISTVTLPALAVSFIVLNAKAPLGSADNLTTEAPPPAVGAAAEVVVALELELELELELGAGTTTGAEREHGGARKCHGNETRSAKTHEAG